MRPNCIYVSETIFSDIFESQFNLLDIADAVNVNYINDSTHNGGLSSAKELKAAFLSKINKKTSITLQNKLLLFSDSNNLANNNKVELSTTLNTLIFSDLTI